MYIYSLSFPTLQMRSLSKRSMREKGNAMNCHLMDARSICFNLFASFCFGHTAPFAVSFGCCCFFLLFALRTAVVCVIFVVVRRHISTIQHYCFEFLVYLGKHHKNKAHNTKIPLDTFELITLMTKAIELFDWACSSIICRTCS